MAGYAESEHVRSQAQGYRARTIAVRGQSTAIQLRLAPSGGQPPAICTLHGHPRRALCSAPSPGAPWRTNEHDGALRVTKPASRDMHLPSFRSIHGHGGTCGANVVPTWSPCGACVEWRVLLAIHVVQGPIDGYFSQTDSDPTALKQESMAVNVWRRLTASGNA